MATAKANGYKKQNEASSAIAEIAEEQRDKITLYADRTTGAPYRRWNFSLRFLSSFFLPAERNGPVSPNMNNADPFCGARASPLVPPPSSLNHAESINKFNKDSRNERNKDSRNLSNTAKQPGLKRIYT